MSRNGYFILATLGVAAVIFFVLGLFSNFFAESSAETEEILTLAKNAVDRPVYPPKPEGRVETKTEEKWITAEFPTVSCRLLKCRTVMKKVRTKIAEYQVEEFVGPATAEIEQWEASVASIEASYEKKLRDEIARIESDRSNKFREEVKDWVGIAGSSLGTVFAGITLLLGIRKDRRESEAS